MEAAMDVGLDTVKFFPAEQAGGLAYLKAVAAPYTGLYFIPTGGISPDNLGKYTAFSRVLACGGSWMVKKELIDVGNFGEITNLCREAIQIIRESRA
jgi:2-dehydro-3-deoxyphosphogluconate aldolase/(4S)-4-hydroxy-2-oxoglutarate aldolase